MPYVCSCLPALNISCVCKHSLVHYLIVGMYSDLVWCFGSLSSWQVECPWSEMLQNSELLSGHMMLQIGSPTFDLLGWCQSESRCSKIPSKMPFRLCVRADRGRQWISCWDTGPMSLRSLILSVLMFQHLQNVHLRYFWGHFQRGTCNFCIIRMQIICPLSLLIPNIDSAYWSSLY